MAGRKDDLTTAEKNEQLALVASGKYEQGLRESIEFIQHEERTRFVPLTKERRERVLTAIRAGMTVKAACIGAGVALRTYTRHCGQDAALKELHDEAMDASTHRLEARMEEIFLAGDPSSMATVRAGEVLLKARSARHRDSRPVTGARARFEQKDQDGNVRSFEVSASPHIPE